MTWRRAGLGFMAVAVLATGWAYALDAAIPDKHRGNPKSIQVDLPPLAALTGAVDYAELGYPGYTGGAPEPRIARLQTLPVLRAEASPLLATHVPTLAPAKKSDSTAWIWLLLAAGLTALAAAAAAVLWRRREPSSAPS